MQPSSSKEKLKMKNVQLTVRCKPAPVASPASARVVDAGENDEVCVIRMCVCVCVSEGTVPG